MRLNTIRRHRFGARRGFRAHPLFGDLRLVPFSFFLFVAIRVVIVVVYDRDEDRDEDRRTTMIGTKIGTKTLCAGLHALLQAPPCG